MREVQIHALLEEREIGAALELPRTLGLDVRLRQDVIGIQPGPPTLRRADGRAPATVTEVRGAQRGHRLIGVWLLSGLAVGSAELAIAQPGWPPLTQRSREVPRQARLGEPVPLVRGPERRGAIVPDPSREVQLLLQVHRELPKEGRRVLPLLHIARRGAVDRIRQLELRRCDQVVTGDVDLVQGPAVHPFAQRKRAGDVGVQRVAGGGREGLVDLQPLEVGADHLATGEARARLR